jgi:hypothetical protein
MCKETIAWARAFFYRSALAPFKRHGFVYGASCRVALRTNRTEDAAVGSAGCLRKS